MDDSQIRYAYDAGHSARAAQLVTLVTVTVALVVAVGFLLSIRHADLGSLAGVVAMVAGLGAAGVVVLVLAAWFLRRAGRVEVTGRTLRWSTVFGVRERPLSHLRRVDAAWDWYRIDRRRPTAVFQFDRGRFMVDTPPSATAEEGLAAFINGVRTLAAHVTVSGSWAPPGTAGTEALLAAAAEGFVRRAHWWYRGWLAGWAYCLLLCTIPVGAAGYLVVFEYSRMSLRHRGPVVAADVESGVPGIDKRLTVRHGDRYLNVTVNSWKGTGTRADGRLDLVIDPDHPGDPDDPEGPFGDRYYGTAVLAHEPYSVWETAKEVSTMLLIVVGGLTALASCSIPLSASRDVLRDRTGLPRPDRRAAGTGSPAANTAVDRQHVPTQVGAPADPGLHRGAHDTGYTRTPAVHWARRHSDARNGSPAGRRRTARRPASPRADRI